MVDAQSIIDELASICGKDYVSDNIYDRIAYGQDSLAPDLPPEIVPSAVVRPDSANQVSKIVEFANRSKTPIYIHGRGTSFKGSPRPKRKGSVIVDLSRLNTLEFKEEDMYYEVGAGMLQIDLERALEKRGYFLPMNVGSKYAATIGGGVAINTIGHMVDPCVGKIMDYVMGVEAVLPNGTVIETGTHSIRRPAGIDLTKFFVGSEGLFGVICKVRIRLVSLPKRAYVVGFFNGPEKVAQVFSRIYKEKLPPPLYGELLGQNTAIPAFEARNLGTPPGDMALVTTMGHSQEDSDLQAENILAVFRAENAIEAHIVKKAEEQEALWEARDFITNMLQREEGQLRRPVGGAFEMGVPLSRLADFFNYIKSGPPGYPELQGTEKLFYGHVGSSGPHVMFLLPKGTPPSTILKSVKEARKLEQEFTIKWGGIGGEVGQTASRISAFRKKYGEGAYSMLLEVKRAIDPNNILNPGNLEGEGYED